MQVRILLFLRSVGAAPECPALGGLPACEAQRALWQRGLVERQAQRLCPHCVGGDAPLLHILLNLRLVSPGGEGHVAVVQRRHELGPRVRLQAEKRESRERIRV